MPTTYGNDIVYCLKSHCGVRGYCRQKWVLQVQIICKFSNERTCKRNKDVQGLSCGFEVTLLCIGKIWRYKYICNRNNQVDRIMKQAWLSKGAMPDTHILYDIPGSDSRPETMTQ